MPTYAYQCRNCGAEFERIESLSERAARAPCPKCGSRHVEQRMTPFYARTARKS